jgi:hypothetical protein
MHLADRAMAANGHANALGDGDLVEAACQHFGRLCALPMEETARQQNLALVRGVLTETAAWAIVLAPL